MEIEQELIKSEHISSLENEYESYKFVNCTFSSVSNISLINCTFTNCNLSNLKFSNSRLQDLKFIECKMLGVNFSNTSDFGFSISFENCLLDYTSFDRKNMNKSFFKNCRLHKANFTEANLSKTTFTNCDLLDAVFSKSNLEGVDLRTSYNFSIDPENNNIKKAKFASHSLRGLLSRHDIIID